jgi:DNA-binding NarL/FixJ family response regulator
MSVTEAFLNPFRVLVVDRNIAIRTGVAAILRSADIQSVYEADCWPDAVRLAQEHQPDVVLIDVRFLVEPGGRQLRRLKEGSPHSAVLMFATLYSEIYASRAGMFGAEGAISKDLPREELLAAIRAADSRRPLPLAPLDTRPPTPPSLV